MYELLALLSGVILSIMVSLNGTLSGHYGVFFAAVIIHVVGSIAAFILRLLRKEKQALFIHQPKWIYLGGAIGVFTTVFNSFAFGRISMTSIVALGLLGQAIASLAIDTFGLFGMKKQNFNKGSIPGFVISFLGIFLMLDQSVSGAIIPVVISFFAGLTIVLSRMINARLAKKIGASNGSLVNHLVGLPVTIVAALLAGQFSTSISISTSQPWIYFGGVFGVLIVLLSNLMVPKMSAFRMSLLIFVGQTFSGVILDLVLGKGYSSASFTGGLIIIIGLAINFVTERIYARSTLLKQE